MRSSLVLALTLLPLATASAEEPRSVAVINLKIDESIPQPDAAQIRAALQQAFDAHNLLDVPQTLIEHQRSAAKELFDCFAEDRCRAGIGRRLKADYIFSGNISKEDDAWEAYVSLFDVKLAVTAKREQVICPHCTVESFQQRLREAVGVLVKAARTIPQGTIYVRTTPAGAEVSIDQRVVGMSNLEVPVAAGTHIVQVTRDGGAPVRISVEVKAKERRDVDLSIGESSRPRGNDAQRSTSPAENNHNGETEHHPPPPKKLAVQKIAGLTLIGVGAALFIASIPFIAEDGQCADSHCINSYDTADAAMGLAISGGGLLVVGGVVLLTAPKEPRLRAAVAPTFDRRGGGLAATISF